MPNLMRPRNPVANYRQLKTVVKPADTSKTTVKAADPAFFDTRIY